MNDFNCSKGCCNIYVKKYTMMGDGNTIWDTDRSSKSGVLLYDEESNMVLLVQSRGNLWGVPKGTVETDETFAIAAIREVSEETGIKLSTASLHTYVKLGDQNCIYYFVKHKKCFVAVQEHIDGNDANSIGWINLDCLHTLLEDSVIKLNRHTKVVLEEFLKFK
jgi:8-oxo-dGTP pyrophosphatase MutT (NUDIX family)